MSSEFGTVHPEPGDRPEAWGIWRRCRGARSRKLANTRRCIAGRLPRAVCMLIQRNAVYDRDSLLCLRATVVEGDVGPLFYMTHLPPGLWPRPLPLLSAATTTTSGAESAIGAATTTTSFLVGGLHDFSVDGLGIAGALDVSYNCKSLLGNNHARQGGGPSSAPKGVMPGRDFPSVGFADDSFNQQIGYWDTTQVTNMGDMLHNSAFNQPIGYWDTSSVTNMDAMFRDSNAFNQPVNDGDTSSVTNIQSID